MDTYMHLLCIQRRVCARARACVRPEPIKYTLKSLKDSKRKEIREDEC